MKKITRKWITLLFIILMCLFVAPANAAHSTPGMISDGELLFQEEVNICQTKPLPDLAAGTVTVLPARVERLPPVPAAKSGQEGLSEAAFLLGEGDRLSEEEDIEGAREAWQAAADAYHEAGDQLGEYEAYIRLAESVDMMQTAFNEQALNLVLGYYQKAIFASVEGYESVMRDKLDLDPDTLSQADALYEEALALSQTGNCEQADPLLDQARQLYQSLEFDSGEVRVLAVKANCQTASGDLMGTLLTTLETIGIAQTLPLPSSTSDRHLEGTALYEQGRYAEALVVLEEARQQYQEAEQMSEVAQVTLDLATVHAALGDLAKAEELYKEALTILMDVDDEYSTYNQAVAHNNLGHITVQRGRASEAISHYTTAIELWQALGEPTLEVTSRNGLGVALRELGNNEEALRTLQEAHAMQEQLSSEPENEGDLLNNMGLVYAAQGNYQQALDEYQRALIPRRKLPTRQKEIETLNNIAAVQGNLGRFDEALDTFKQALSLAEGQNSPYLVASIRSNMANVYHQQGNYQTSLATYLEILPIFEANEEAIGHKDPNVARIHNQIALTYLSFGDPEKARSHFIEALNRFEQVGQLEGSALVRTGLGELALQYESDDSNNLTEAETCFEQAKEIWQALDNPAGVVSTLGPLAIVASRQNDLPAALARAKEGLALNQKVGSQIAKVRFLLLIGNSHLQNEDYPDALDVGQQVLELATELGDPAIEIMSHTFMSFVYRGSGQQTLAYEQFQIAIERLEKLQGTVTIEDLKTAFFERWVDLYTTGVFQALEQGLDEDAFQYAEQARARAFLDQLRNGQVDLRADVDPTLLEKEQTQRAEIAALRQQLVELHNQTGDKRDNKAMANVQAELTSLEERYTDLLVQLQIQSPETASLISPDVASLTEVQNLLDDDTTLVKYFVTGESTLVFIITPQTFEVVRLPILGEELGQRVNDLRAVGLLPVADPHSTELKELYQSLIVPLRPHLNTQSLIIIPHNTLHYLPFAALTDGERYLSDDYVLSTLPSASMLRFLKEKRKAEANNILALGNPTIETPRFSPLKYAAEEAKAIAELYPTQVLTGSLATESSVWSEASNHGILHLAAHGEYNELNPLFSTIHLASDSEHDGRLEVHELYSLNLTTNTDLVVLSACQTQVGRFSSGDDVVTLNRAFIYAGAPSIIASLWSVDDTATSLLMQRFYKHLQAGMGKAEALRQAQLDTRTKYPNPYYWAGFVLTGDGGPITNLAPAGDVESNNNEATPVGDGSDNPEPEPVATESASEEPVPEPVATESAEENVGLIPDLGGWPLFCGGVLLFAVVILGGINRMRSENARNRRRERSKRSRSRRSRRR